MTVPLTAPLTPPPTPPQPATLPGLPPTLKTDGVARTIRALVLQSAAFGGRSAAAVAIQLWLASLVSPAGFGIFALAVLALDLAAALAHLHLGAYLSRESGTSGESSLPGLVLIQLAASAVVVACGEAASGPVLAGLGWSGAVEPLRWLLLAAFLIPQNILLRAAFERRMEHGRASIPGLLALLAQVSVAVPLASRGDGAMALVAGLLAREAAELAVLLVLAARRLSWEWGPAPVGETVRFALPLVPAAFLAVVYCRLDEGMAALFLGVGPLGLYHLASRIPQAFLSSRGPIPGLGLSLFTRLSAEPTRLRAAFEALTAVSGYIHFSLGSIGIGLVGPLLAVLLDARWGEAALPLCILCGVAAIRGPLSLWTTLYRGLRIPAPILTGSALSCLIFLGLGPPLVAVGGVAGVAAALAGATLFNSLFLAPRQARMALPGVRPLRALAGPGAVAGVNLALGLGAGALGLLDGPAALIALGAGLLLLDMPLSFFLERRRLEERWRTVQGRPRGGSPSTGQPTRPEARSAPS